MGVMKKPPFFIVFLFFLFSFVVAPLSQARATSSFYKNFHNKVEVNQDTSLSAKETITVNFPSRYTVKNFHSEVEVNQDTSLTVKETITVDFPSPRHGIFRVIPVIYSHQGKTIYSHLEVLSITDEKGNAYDYQTSRYQQSVKIRIGDPERTVSGRHTYVIKYRVDKVVRQYDDYWEVYWNVTGHEWDTVIENASAVVVSPYAEITKISCFSGRFGSQEKNCQGDFDSSRASFITTKPIVPGNDFTVVVALSKDNQFKSAGLAKRVVDFLLGNLGYLLALMPLLIMFIFWYKKGRDRRYLTDNVYYRPENRKTKTVSLFAREHLPTVYSPIDNLTPAQVGTIIDEKVDTKDVVAEIVELARLGYLKIKKVTKKGLIGKKTDYLFIKKEKDERGLKDYQKYLLESLFSVKEAASQNDSKEDKSCEVFLSSLKNKFYQYLPKFKDKLYQNLVKEKIFTSNPEKERIKWLVLAIVMFVVDFWLIKYTIIFFGNFLAQFLLLLTVAPVGYLAISMPRRTAWGHSLYRQIKGLRWYLEKSKWREEIAEKHLFLEEVLPLAISLGVVKKLAKDMASLGVKPPDYFEGVTESGFYSAIGSFYRSSSTALASSPSSGRSSWSGGSGFSGGGSSGGGFGGGGGGSW